MSKSLFAPAIRAGAVICLAIATPAALIQANLSDDAKNSQSNWVYLTLLAIVMAYLAGGAVAGRLATDAPMINGAAATVTAFAVVQFVATVVRIADGDGINPLALLFNALLAAAIGTVGAGIGACRANKAHITK